jgi:hypothetical protein
MLHFKRDYPLTLTQHDNVFFVVPFKLTIFFQRSYRLQYLASGSLLLNLLFLYWVLGSSVSGVKRLGSLDHIVSSAGILHADQTMKVHTPVA